jgi:membrane protein YqaA with SNARE-associated domain
VFDFVSTIGVQNLIQTYGLWVLFGVVMFESLGVPMPGETALISAALYSGATHQVDIVSVVGVAALAAIIGDNFGYLIGRSIGLRLIVVMAATSARRAPAQGANICFCGTAARSSSRALGAFARCLPRSRPEPISCPGAIS